MSQILKYKLINEDGSFRETLSLSEAQAHGNYEVVEEIITPVEEVIKISAKRMYFLLALLQLHDIKTSQIVTAINQVPNEFLREAMLIKFNTATFFERDDAGINMLAPVFGLTSEDLDNIFNFANRLDI